MSDSIRTYQQQLRRTRYMRDLPTQQARYVYELHMAQGDALLAFGRGLPTQALVERLNHIFAMWRTP